MKSYSVARRVLAAEQWRKKYLTPMWIASSEDEAAIERSVLGGSLLSRPLGIMTCDGNWRRATIAWAKMHNPDLTAAKKGAEAAKAFARAVLALPEWSTELVIRYAGDVKVGWALDLQAEWERTHVGASQDERIVAYFGIRECLDVRFGQGDLRLSNFL